jgi:hypothetical protein
VLQIASLDQEGGTGPVYTSADIVDLGPIGTGQLPGEAVTVSYSTLKLKAPQDDAAFTLRTLWEEEEEVSEIAYYYIAFEGGTAVYAGRDVTTTTTTYKTVPANEQIAGNYYLVTGDTKEVVDRRETEVKSPDVKGLGQLASSKLSNGGFFPATDRIASKVITTYEYDPTGELERTTTLEYEDQAFAAYRLPIPLIFGSSFVEIGSGLKLVSRTVNSDEKYGDYTKRVTSRYVWWPFSQVGQQAVAEAKETFTTVAAVESYVGELLGAGLVHDGTQINSTRVGLSGSEGRPSSAELTNGAYAKDGDPNNGWRTESKADLELALGSATAQRRIEFSMPYAPDDIFSGPSGGPFTATPSDAPAKANRYGRVQNRLLLGNRSGVNLQLAPERLPVAPFSPLYLQADGLTALYRANGNQWAFDSNGIVCSTDALFWAAVGGTGTFWFPVAPGVTTLPAEPAIVDGQMNATNVVLPYNETAIYEGRLRLGNVVTKFDYSLSLLTVVPPIPIKIKVSASKGILGNAGAFALSGQIANLQINRRTTAAAGAFTLTPQPTILRPPYLVSDAATYSLSGQQALLTRPSGDPYWNDVKLLLHMDGANNSTTFTDSSPVGRTMTRAGNTIISTAQSKFGGASGFWDGSSDSVQAADSDDWNIGAGDFTVEGWIITALTSTRPILSQRGSASSNFAFDISAGSNSLLFQYSTDGTTVATLSAVWATSILSTWTHFAICRSGTNLRFFQNGTLLGTQTLNATVFNSTAALNVGLYGGGTSSWSGYIDELRFTRAARYTSSFSVQTAAFPEYAQTV